MNRSIARKLPLLRRWILRLEELERRHAKLKRQRDNLKAELARATATVESLRKEKTGIFARQHRLESSLPIPPASLRRRVHGASDEGDFLYVGATAARHLRKILQEEQRSLDSFGRILDFGSGCGRVLRFFEDRPESCKLFGTDVDAEAIGWCKDNLSSLGTFATNTSQPPLEYESNFFDLVLAVSVFTHLSEDLEQMWLEELHRIAMPGAMLLLSIHGARCLGSLAPEFREQFEQSGFLYAHLGDTAGLPEWYQTSFHSHEYIHRSWTKWFDIRRIAAMGHQDVAVCQKR